MTKTALTPRMEGMLDHLAAGWTYHQIGAEYGVTGGRVGQILREAREILGVKTDPEAIAEGARRGLVRPDFQPGMGRRAGT